MGAQVRIKGGQLRGGRPFVETGEGIGGYAIFELRDKEEALASAKEFMQLHKDLMPGWEGTCELRRVRRRLRREATRRSSSGRRRPSRNFVDLADRTAVVDH